MNSETRKIYKDSTQTAEKWQIPSMDSERSDVFRNENETESKAETKAPQDPAIPTAEEIEKWHKQAHEEGYQQGLQQAQQETDELKNKLLEIIGFFEKPLQSLNDEVEEQLNLLAVTLAQQLVRREIRAEPGEIIALIKESVQLLPASSRRIRIILHPEDAVLVRETLQLEEFEEDQSWKLMEDGMITRGGCQIKSDKSEINVTLENRLQALAASVLGGERVEDKSDEDKDDEPVSD